MPTTCDIEFENNPQKVVYAGQLLRGTVRLTLTEEKNVRGIYIRIYGKAYAHWSRGSGKSRRTYTGEEHYLNETTYFVGGRDGEMKVGPGAYNYGFQCSLPAGLPTSVEGNVGYIRYTTRVVLDIPLWPNKEFKQRFTVVRPINLNADPLLRNPLVAEIDTRFNLFGLLCCFLSGPLNVTVRMPVGGYTPGQIINMQISVRNQSDQPVTEFRVQLLKRITFYADADSLCCADSVDTTEKVLMFSKNTEGCGPNQDEIIRINIEMPPIPPTDLSSSNVVKVKYYMRIIGAVDGCHKNPVLKIPIVVGTYPISDGIGDPTMSTPSPPPERDAPPTYEEAMDMGDGGFRPKYPTFKRAFSYSSIGEY